MGGACRRKGSHGKVNIEETDGSGSKQNEYKLAVLVHGGIRP